MNFVKATTLQRSIHTTTNLKRKSIIGSISDNDSGYDSLKTFYQIIVICSIEILHMMSFFKKLFGSEVSYVDWETVKHAEKVYPESSITILLLTLPNGLKGTGWVDMAYRKYEFKVFCPYHVSISVDFHDHVAKENPDLDMGEIEDFFSDELQKICICHMISRQVSEVGMEIDCYVEADESVEQILRKLSLDENRLVSFTYKIDFDPKWKKVRYLFNV
ncbi:hypothetical protein OKW96_20325 [Sphingobacterium sp. KU25419]|nr:hypothetical protein OKW96_20325 [Sphingobacterium sp. KU25419]